MASDKLLEKVIGCLELRTQVLAAFPQQHNRNLVDVAKVYNASNRTEFK